MHIDVDLALPFQVPDGRSNCSEQQLKPCHVEIGGWESKEVGLRGSESTVSESEGCILCNISHSDANNDFVLYTRRLIRGGGGGGGKCERGFGEDDARSAFPNLNDLFSASDEANRYDGGGACANAVEEWIVRLHFATANRGVQCELGQV